MEKSESTEIPKELRELIRNPATEELLQSLPKERLSDGMDVSFYDGFWCPSIAVNGAISFQQQFQPEETDLILASFPKSGTTWLKALAFTIVHRQKHPLADSPLHTSTPHELVPSFEFGFMASPNGSNPFQDIPKPRILSTHMPYASLPTSITHNSNCRFVYICRNPIDQFISQWHFNVKMASKTNYSVSLEEAFDKFCRGVCWYGPIWDHILGYWKASREMPERVLFLKYEDLKEDIVSRTKLLAEFLGFPFSEEEESQGIVEELARLCSFENLKELEVNKTGKHFNIRDNSDFYRKGKIGDWSNYLTPEMAERAKNLIREKFEGSGLNFRLS